MMENENTEFRDSRSELDKEIEKRVEKAQSHIRFCRIIGYALLILSIIVILLIVFGVINQDNINKGFTTVLTWVGLFLSYYSDRLDDWSRNYKFLGKTVSDLEKEVKSQASQIEYLEEVLVNEGIIQKVVGEVSSPEEAEQLVRAMTAHSLPPHTIHPKV